MLPLMNILVIIFGLTTIFGLEKEEFINAIDSMNKLLKRKFTLLNDIKKQFNAEDLVSFRNKIRHNEKFGEASEILNQQISNSVTMFLLLRGLSEEWRRVEEREDEVLYKHCNLLCNDKIPLPDGIKKQLKCRYLHEGTPFLKIAPFKEEEIYPDPRIVMFHDVISDEEINTLKYFAEPLLMKSEIHTRNGPEVSEARIGQTAEVFNEDHKHVEDVNRRTEHMTNLNIDTAEELQVTYYKLGGKYEGHFDFDLNQTWPFGGTGNRIATSMYYLNDVEAGGNTIFIDLNVTIVPKKGSAIFWYNLRKNGDLNLLMAHSGCPVTAGTKWIANKWFNEIGQEFRRPCTWEKQETRSSRYYHVPPA